MTVKNANTSNKHYEQYNIFNPHQQIYAATILWAGQLELGRQLFRRRSFQRPNYKQRLQMIFHVG